MNLRDHLDQRTFESIQGIKKAVVHIDNSTSTLQRDVVSHMEQEEIKRIAVDGVAMVTSRYLQHGKPPDGIRKTIIGVLQTLEWPVGLFCVKIFRYK